MRITPAGYRRLALSAVTLHSQDLTGTWPGTIIASPNDVRTIIKITKADKGVPDPPDVAPRFFQEDWVPSPVAAIEVQGNTVAFAASVMEVTYEGKLTADGNFFNGTWAHGPATPWRSTWCAPRNATAPTHPARFPYPARTGRTPPRWNPPDVGFLPSSPAKPAAAAKASASAAAISAASI